MAEVRDVLYVNKLLYMSKKFVTEEQLSEVVDLIVEQEKFTVDKVNSNFKNSKGVDGKPFRWW